MQTIFLNPFSGMKIIVFVMQISLQFVPDCPISTSPACLVPSHYLNQLWSGLKTHVCVTCPQWVNVIYSYCNNWKCNCTLWWHRMGVKVSWLMGKWTVLKDLFWLTTKKPSNILITGHLHKGPIMWKTFPCHDVIINDFKQDMYHPAKVVRILRIINYY